MSSAGTNGRITSGVSPQTAAKVTLDFVERNLAAWRDDPTRTAVTRERDLNSQLCKFLNYSARAAEFGMIQFHHEELQGTVHSADLSATPLDEDWIEGRPYSKYSPILVIEGKRLPSPGSGREREYVTSAPDKKPAGGIQRFKLGSHGQSLSAAGMIGYVQSRRCTDWFADINRWIEELESSSLLWSQSDRLTEFAYDPKTRVSHCASQHRRESCATPIGLTHLWVEMGSR